MASRHVMACLAVAFGTVILSSRASTQEEETDAETCESSLLQRGRDLARKAPCTSQCGALQKPSHLVSVPAEGLEEHIKPAGPGSGLPEAVQGIWWMDQTGYMWTRPDKPDNTSGVYETIPGKEAWYKTFPFNLPGYAPELLLTFAGLKMDPETSCIEMSVKQNHWVYANSTGDAIGSLYYQNVPLIHEDIFIFCWNKEMTHANITMKNCSTGEIGGRHVFHIIVHPWGWERLTPGDASQDQVSTRYAVFQIVDGNGQRTKYYEAFQDFMKMRCWYGGPHANPAWLPGLNSPECPGGALVNFDPGNMLVGRFDEA